MRSRVIFRGFAQVGWRMMTHLGLLVTALICQACAVAPAPRSLWTVPSPAGWTIREILVDGGRIYVASDAQAEGTNPAAHRLTAIELASGKEIWSQEIDQMVRMVVMEGRVVYLTAAAQASSQAVIALDGLTGQEVWRLNPVQEATNLEVRGGYLFVVGDAEVLCLDGATGARQATYPARVAGQEPHIYVWHLFAFTETAYYLLEPSGQLHTYSVPGGDETATITLPLNGAAEALAISGTRAYVHTIPGEWPGETTVFDLPSGGLLWRAAETNGLKNEIVAASGVYAAIFQLNGVGIFDVASGQRLYGVDSDRSMADPETTASFLGLRDGKLSAYDLVTGKILWSAATTGREGLALDVRGDLVYAITGKLDWGGPAYPTDLEVFDLKSSELIWRLKQRITSATFVGDRLLVYGERNLALVPLRP